MFALMQRADQNQNLADRLRTVFARRGLRARRAAVAGFTMIEIMIVVLIIGILLSIAAPNFAKAREQTRKKSCVGNLRQIQYAKDAYLMDNNLATTVTPADTDQSDAAVSGRRNVFYWEWQPGTHLLVQCGRRHARYHRQLEEWRMSARHNQYRPFRP